MASFTTPAPRIGWDQLNPPALDQEMLPIPTHPPRSITINMFSHHQFLLLATDSQGIN